MPKGFLPNSDGALLAWANRFANGINSSPADYGLSVEQAAQFSTLRDTYAAKLATSSAPGTRTVVSVSDKNAARAAMKAAARLLMSIVQGQSNVTAAQKLELGLNPRDRKPSRIAAPPSAPVISVLSVRGRSVRVRLVNGDSIGRRGRPVNVAGATIFVFIGEEEPPAAISQWKFYCNTSRTNLDVHLPEGTAPGTKVWIAAWWLNSKLQRGPASHPIAANIPGGLEMQMKLAA